MYLRRSDLLKLNTLTKYPSIETYHKLGEKGRLTEATNVVFEGDVILTEQVDGTNARLVITSWGEWLIGSREEFLTANADIVHNPALGIVDAIRPIAHSIDTAPPPNTLHVFFFEVFGAGIGGQAKQYTTKTERSVRLFDVAVIESVDDKMRWERERISAWRDGCEQFVTEWKLDKFVETLRLKRVPVIKTVDAKNIPQDIAGMHAFLKEYAPATQVRLDDSGHGKAEGLVLRSPNRRQIAKVRFEDYERTAKIRKKELEAAEKAQAAETHVPEQSTRRYAPARRTT